MNRSVPTTSAWPNARLEEVARDGANLYEGQLKAGQERDAMGQMVAIHSGSGDYSVADREEDAISGLRARRPKGLLFVRRIGPPTAGDLRLAARLERGLRGK